MTAAIFGLIGVVVGAALTGAVNWLLERRRERAEAQAAARLLKSEVEAAISDVASTLAEGMWPISYQPTWRQSWSSYRRPLAARMDPEAFEAAAKAYARMDQLQSAFSAGRAEDRRQLSYADRDFLENKAQPTLAPADQALSRFLST
jgi:hypothetical protein